MGRSGRRLFAFTLLLGGAVLCGAGCSSKASGVANARDASGSGGAVDGGGNGGSGGSVGWPDAAAGAPAGGAAGAGASAGSGAGGTAGSGTGGTAGSGSGGCPSAGWTYQCAHSCPLSFPQGVPDPDFIEAACSYSDTDKNVDQAVNAVMASLTGCGVGSNCPLTGVVAGTTTNEICQNWFAAVTAALRAQGYCAGQHAVGSTDEIAVNDTCCEGKWYGYHICYYGGPTVVWNPGARRGWWAIKPSYCGP